ncbi:MAG: ATP-binding protein, partial [Desulfurococcales archaeon]|nr:ATP-binding protein [Desulfurococcales archaeon]
EEVIVPLRRSIITAFKLEKANLNEVRGFSFKGPPIMILSPLWMMSWGIHEILEGIIFLRHPDIGAVGKPREIRGSMYLSERAENLGEVLLTLQAKSGSLPDPIVYALKKGFPGLTVRLEIGLGRVALVAEEMGVRLNPPNMPDGLIKLLAIATAASLEPSVLLIDELENSMHAELLELAIDMLNRLETPVLIATHSPLVVDMVEPERVIVLSKEPGGPTRVERLSEKRDLLRRLEELGVSLGDAVFHSVTRRD